MSTYIRGPICGVDNCPSQLWRVIAGRRTCQYGHVMEGDVEFNDEDDVANSGVITRRLNLTTSLTGSFQSSLGPSQLNASQSVQRDQKVYGEKARILFLKSFQYILKRQATYLIEEMDFPEEFDVVVKSIWMEYLKYLTNKHNDNQDILGADDTEVDNHDNQDESLIANHTNSMHAKVNPHKEDKLDLHITTTIAILYLASLHLGLPIYLCDFRTYICVGKLPYYKANRILPKMWKTKLPNYYLGLLEGGAVPKDGQILHKILFTCAKIDFCSKSTGKINIEGLLLKLIMFTNLPPEFFFFTLNLVELVDDQDSFRIFGHDKKTFKSYQKYPELRVIAFYIISIRWVLMCDGLNDGDYHYPTKWISRLLEEAPLRERSKHRVETSIAELFHEDIRSMGFQDDRDPYRWTEEETTDFLDWMEKEYLGFNEKYNTDDDWNRTIDQRIAKRKLLTLLPLESDLFPITRKSNSRISFIEELQEKYIYLKNFDQVEHNRGMLHEDNDNENLVTRSKSIAALESKLIRKLSAYFGVSNSQLKSSIDKIEKHCIISVKHY